MTQILTNAANGTESTVQTHLGDAPVQLQLTGNFDGGTVQVQVSQDGLPFTTLIQVTPFTAPDANDIEFAQGTNWKLVITGGGGSTSISASFII